MKIEQKLKEQPIQDQSEIIAIRQKKLKELRSIQKSAYPNHFQPKHKAGLLHQAYPNADQQLLLEKINVCVAGRIMTNRIMGKASFFHLQDETGRIQVYVQQKTVGEKIYQAFKSWDLGDIIGLKGHLFFTKVGELTIWAEQIEFLTKCLSPLPEKFHGLKDKEQRYRQRYLDLLVNQESKEVFKKRSSIISFIRTYMESQFFLEVETPMMQSIPGGANAKPFETWHNALNRPLFLRIAPELYLKRLIVGGFEKVFEINRNFRNEGLSTRHNPEFTTVEFYQAYATYENMMKHVEDLIQSLVNQMFPDRIVHYQNQTYSFKQPFRRIQFLESILLKHPDLKNIEHDDQKMRSYAKAHHIGHNENDSALKILCNIFDKTIEPTLDQPTFVTHYPKIISPLARAFDDQPHLTERFELFIAGREIANGFSELNDPEEQANRFFEQAKKRESGDEESMFFDSDYIKALQCGMPPTAGAGIGIDRLVMLLTNTAAIKDVILFPHLKD